MIELRKTEEWSSRCEDYFNWRDEHDVVHVLARHVDEHSFIDAEGRMLTTGYIFWRTPCDITFDNQTCGTPVYVAAPVNCVICLEHA